MIIHTLVRKGTRWDKLAFEIELVPGLPIMHFLNAPGSAIKEATIRLRTAFKNCDLPWPRTQSIVINFQPSDLHWQSEGLDLALAVAVLTRMGVFQPNRLDLRKTCFYGGVSLSGEIFAPDDLRTLTTFAHPVFTGAGNLASANHLYFSPHLSALVREEYQTSVAQLPRPQRPPQTQLSWAAPAAKLMEVIAAGEHSVLLAGAQGTGKTTFAESLHSVLPLPFPQQWAEILRVGHWIGEERTHRPLRSPHHTTPVRSLLGGGRPIVVGEITRAHGGILLLDEFLEFHPQVQEGLREPLEQGAIALSRQGQVQDYPARFLFVGTTNLCPCGRMVPGVPRDCSIPLLRCRSVAQRLSGPVLDRIELLAFTKNWQQAQVVSLDEIRQRAERARRFAFRIRKQTRPNGYLSIDQLKATLSSAAKFVFENGSGLLPRRKRAVLRVARTLADLRASEAVELEDWNQALDLVELPRQEFSQMFA